MSPRPPPLLDRRRARLLRLGIVLLCLGVFATHALSYLPFLSDDALISLRYAQRLLEGRGLTWNDGERVEGYSNLLWILATGGLGGLGMDLVVTQRVLGLACGAVAILAVAATPSRLASLAGGATLAVSGTLAAWGVGGLEVDLLAALLALALAGALAAESRAPGQRRAPLALIGVSLALLVLTRPDAALFAPALCVALLVGARARPVELLFAGGPAALAWLGQLAFRLTYYGAWLPNTAHAKLATSTARLMDGAQYLGAGLLWAAPLTLGAFLLGRLLWRGGARGRVLLLVFPALAWAVYALFVIGGDVFPARRHLVPLWISGAFLVREGTERWLAARPLPGRKPLLALAFGLALLAGLQAFDPANRRARAERWEWDGQVVGWLLRDAFADRDPLLAVDPAGCVPFFSGLRSLDMLGLNDAYIAATPPPDLGTGIPGHELGNGAYVLDREPDLILFTQPAGHRHPTFRSARELVGDPRFAARYRFTRLRGRRPHDFLTRPWIRAEGGPLGIERSEGGVRIPGWFLTETGRCDARLDRGGALAARITPRNPGAILALALPGGSYDLALEGEVEGLTVTVTRSEPTSAVLAAGRPPLSFDLEAGTRVDLHLEAPAGRDEAAAFVRAVLLRSRTE